MTSVTLNADSKGATGAKLSLTTETMITLHVLHVSGTQENGVVGVDISPDGGTTWITLKENVRGVGCVTYNFVATDVRACVIKSEGSASSVKVYLLAR